MHERRHPTEDSDEIQLSFLEQVQKFIFYSGWSRHLLVENVSDSEQPYCVIRVRRIAEESGPNGFSETDIVGLYSEEAFLKDQISVRMIRAECRAFLIENNLI